MQILRTADPGFEEAFARVVAERRESGADVGRDVAAILAEVRERGDAAVAELELPPAGILKIDVEGFEAEVLAGLRATLERDRPVILFELSDRTRGAFKHEEGLRASLYADHRLYEVGTRSVRPYVIGGLIGLVMLGLLVRSLRPRG